MKATDLRVHLSRIRVLKILLMSLGNIAVMEAVAAARIIQKEANLPHR